MVQNTGSFRPDVPNSLSKGTRTPLEILQPLLGLRALQFLAMPPVDLETLVYRNEGATYLTSLAEGGAVKDRKRKFRRLYQSLHSKGTRGARRRQHRLGGKQRRWQREQNHLLANAIVKEAKDCGAQGIA
jgi:hypothetical protein